VFVTVSQFNTAQLYDTHQSWSNSQQRSTCSTTDYVLFHVRYTDNAAFLISSLI